MSSTLFLFEFRSRLRSVITWAVASAAVIFLYYSFFPAFARDTALINETMASFPPEFRAAFGLGNVDFSTVLGFFTFVYLFIQILLAVQASNDGVGLVSVEERALTADFLMTRPVTRFQILTSKLLAAVAALLLTDSVVWIVTFIAITLFRDGHSYDQGLLIKMLLALIPFQWFFLTVGLLISLLVRRVRSVTPYAMALAFGMYVLGAFGDMLGESAFEKLTPFKHFDPNYVVEHGHFDIPLVMISIVVILISVVASYWLYLRRDIPSVV